MAHSRCSLAFLLIILSYSVPGEATVTETVIVTSPTVSMNTNASMHLSNSLSEIQPSIHWINGSCRIMPSTCICDQMKSVNVSMNISMINMTSPSPSIVSMTMTPDHTGSSYLSPMNSTVHPNMTMNMTAVPCTCHGQRTWCRKNITVSPTATTAVPPNTVESNNNNGNNNGNNNQNNNIVSSSFVSSLMTSVNEEINPSTMLSYTPSMISLHIPSVHSTAIMDQSLVLMSETVSVPVIPESASPPASMMWNPNASVSMMSNPSASMSEVLNPSSSMSVLMETSTTPGGEVIPVPTTLPPVCVTDCANVSCGTAIVNSCGHCVEGTTGLDSNHGKDCNNVCDGSARNDSCGLCTNPPANDPDSLVSPFTDCNGDCFGGADIDSCGNCSGGSSGRVSDFWKDMCGICGGDNSSCMGCDGVPNSGKIRDSCGVCGGDGSTCTNITSIHPSLLPSSSTFGRTVNVVGAGLSGESIKCVFDGQESAGTLVNLTICQCTIPNEVSAGSTPFTVKVVKDGVDTPTADLTISIYDATNVKVTTVSPAEFETNTPAQLVFEGSGLIENSAAVCVIRTDSVMKIPAVFNSGSYSCMMPGYEMSINMTVGLSINGIHELNSDVDLNRIVYATAPANTSSQFTDTGAKIIIAFDNAIARTSLASCSDIFSTGLSSLGTNPTCSWSDGRHLEIIPAMDATIEPGNSLTFATDTIKQDQLFSKFLNGGVTITAPASPVTPVPVIVGPTQISSCGHLTLDGSQSSGGGGRSLTYSWSLESPVNAEVTTILGAAQENVFINGTLLTSGTTYVFKLAVSNFLSSAAVETTISVTKASDPLPEVTVEGPLQGKAMAANSFYITAIAQAASCSAEKALSYSWSVVCTNDDGSNSAKTRAESSSGFQLTSNKAALKIDSGSLVGEKTYRFTVVVSLTNSPNIATTMNTEVIVEWSPLEPAIAGGDRTLGRDSGTLELDAKSSTVDPDNAPGELSCAWTCTDTSNDQPCLSAVNRQSITLPNDCLVSLSSTEFEAGKVYKIKSDVSKGSRTGSSTMLLTVLEGNPPAVSVVQPSMKVVAGEKVNLEATYTSSVEPTIEWICAQEDDYRYVDLSDQSVISSSSDQYSGTGTSFTARILNAYVLAPGSTYKFIVNVNDGSKTGSSNIIVEVRSGPTSGSFEVQPLSLEQLQEITLKASLWVTDADAYPLKYEFGFLDENGNFQAWATQTGNEYTIAAPPGYGPNNILTLRMKVKDAFGSMKYMDKNITVNEPSSLDESLVENLVAESLQEAQDSGDYSEAVPTISNILNVVKNSNSSDNLTAKVMNSTAETLIKAVESTLLDEEKAKPILDTILDLDVQTLQTPKEILDSLEKVTVAHDGNIEEDKIEESMKFLEDLAARCDLSDSEVVQDLVSADDELASSLAKSVSLGDATVEKSSTRCDITAQYSLLNGDITTKRGAEPSQVDFGDELRSKYGFWECDTGKYCMGVKLTFVNYKQDYYSSISSTKPGILSAKVLSVTLRNPETGGTLSVSNLNTPITVSFETGVPSAGKTFKGYYFSESQNKWSDYGLTSTMEGGTLKVTTNHLTTFAPAEEDAVSPTTDSVSVAPSSNSVFQVSFVLSNVTWNDTYSNSSHPDYKTMEDAILAELNNVYQGDPTLKNIVLDKFEESGGNVKVIVKMTFDDSNDDPGAKLKESLSDGKLGPIGVDKDSVKWVDFYAHSESESDEDTELIIGTVFGIFFGLAIILLVAAWLKNRQSRRKVGSSHPSVNEDPAPHEDPVIEETPA